MIKRFLIIIFVGLVSVAPVFALTQEDSNKVAMEKAKQDYKIYLDKLKDLSHQYRGVTNEITKIANEEGVPVWDENTGEIEVKKGTLSPSPLVSPGTEVKESDKDISVKVDLPGLKKDSIKVNIENNKTLNIQGEMDSATQKGPFQRSIDLPTNVKDEGTQAHYDNGVLSIKVLKALPSTKKEIAVNVK